MDTAMERTRDQVVRLLNERGDCSIAELAELIGVSSGSIRRHIDLMVGDGLLEARLERQPRGRPVTRYSLSEAGEEQSSGQHYQRLLSRLSPALAALQAEEIAGADGNDIVSRIFDHVAESVAAEYRPRVHGDTLGERVYQVTLALSEEGILEEVEDAGDHFRLRNMACPYRSTAAENHACCDADRRTIELLLGQPVEQVKTVAEGGMTCEYLVAKGEMVIDTQMTRDGGALATGLLPVVAQKGTAGA
jgi:predicted ArsR family transcriptional regulator